MRRHMIVLLPGEVCPSGRANAGAVRLLAVMFLVDSHLQDSLPPRVLRRSGRDATVAHLTRTRPGRACWGRAREGEAENGALTLHHWPPPESTPRPAGARQP